MAAGAGVLRVPGTKTTGCGILFLPVKVGPPVKENKSLSVR